MAPLSELGTLSNFCISRWEKPLCGVAFFRAAECYLLNTSACVPIRARRNSSPANMSFGDLRINGALASNEKAGASNDGYMIGASMPLVGALSGGLTYASNKDSGLGNMSTVSLQYTLSKATFAYATYNKFSKSIGVLANDSGLGGGDSISIIGLAHSF
jgi:hypothetical protein